VQVVELPDDLATRRNSRRPALWLAAAASIVVIVGGLALLARNRNASTSLTGVTTDGGKRSDLDVRDALVGQWNLSALSFDSGGFLGGGDASQPAPRQAVLGFKENGGGVVLTTSWCGTVVSSGYRIEDGRLVLTDSLSGIEGHCDRPASARSHQNLVALLEEHPTIGVSDNVLTITGSSKRKATMSRTDGTSELDASTSAPPPTTVSTATSVPSTPERFVPTMQQLDGKRFDIVRVVLDGVEREIIGAALLGVDGTRFFFGTECNGGSGEARIEDGRIIVDRLGSILRGCRGDLAQQDDVLGLIVTSRPTITRQGDALTLTKGTALIEARLHDDAATSSSTSATTPASEAQGPVAYTPVVPRDPQVRGPAPTLEQLDGRTYDIIRFVVDGSETPIVGRPPTFAVTGSRVAVATGCNDLGGEAHLDGDRLVPQGWVQTVKGCADDVMNQEQALSTLFASAPTIAVHYEVLTVLDAATGTFIEASRHTDPEQSGSPDSTIGAEDSGTVAPPPGAPSSGG